MSIVVNVFTQNKSYVMADGRAMDHNAETIVDEIAMKIIVPIKNIGVGITGNGSIARGILGRLQRLNLNTSDIDLVFEQINKLTQEAQKELNCIFEFNMIITGISSANEIISYSYNARDFSYSRNKHSGDGYSYIIHTDIYPEESFHDMSNHLGRTNYKSNEEWIIESMEKYIYETSLVNKYVNTNVRQLIISVNQ
ncbi:MAG: hypothetical protein IJX53_00485 [Clostridia bacterium]|nr:hypothetical protein [Clostridia bacterium]